MLRLSHHADSSRRQASFRLLIVLVVGLVIVIERSPGIECEDDDEDEDEEEGRIGHCVRPGSVRLA
jgi:hypothetical protein